MSDENEKTLKQRPNPNKIESALFIICALFLIFDYYQTGCVMPFDLSEVCGEHAKVTLFLLVPVLAGIPIFYLLKNYLSRKKTR